MASDTDAVAPHDQQAHTFDASFTSRSFLIQLIRSASPVILSLFLQYSVTATSIFFLATLGKTALAAVSLASMTANITGFAVFQGLATSLDTLCSQSFGAGNKADLGVWTQRMLCLLALSFVPVAAVWWLSYHILMLAIPDDPVVVELASRYLRILCFGAPGYAAFECAKRWFLAQGFFDAPVRILVFLAPVNVILHWVFIFGLGWGFVGAPIAAAITNISFPVGVAVYVWYISRTADGARILDCWLDFDRHQVFREWWPMVKLSFFGFVVVEAEWLAFEILTLAAGRLGRDELAVQGILISMGTYTSQLPIAIGSAAAMITGNLYGASRLPETRRAVHLALSTGIVQGTSSMVIVLALTPLIARATSEDTSMLILMQRSIPIVAGFQLLDSLVQISNSLLRAVGRQDVASLVSLPSFFVLGLPVSFVLAFKTHAGLYGLWAGPFVATVIICTVQVGFLYKGRWKREALSPTLRAQSEPLLNRTKADDDCDRSLQVPDSINHRNADH